MCSDISWTRGPPTPQSLRAEKGNTPGACHEGIGDTGELLSRVPCLRLVFNPSFEPALSTARLATYRAIARDDEHAWGLYRWNLDLAAAFTPLACDVEVTLRNTIHDQMTKRFGRQDWWASTSLVLDDITTETLATVVQRHHKKMAKGSIGPGKVVADLMLGTWVMLLSRGGTSSLGRAIDYEANLWRPALRFGFATGELTPKGRVRRPTRDAVHTRVSNFQRLRNRSAHHEPIFDGVRVAGTTHRIGIVDLWNGTIELLQWMAPDLAALHRASPAVPRVFAARP